MALIPGSLSDHVRTSASIVLPSGRVIDSPANVAKLGPLEHFDISRNRLENLTKSSKIDQVSPHRVGNSKVWMAAQRIPGSSLTLIHTRPRNISAQWKTSLIIFATLFAGTGAIIWALIRNLMRQIKLMKANARETEISKQRFQAAVDGSRGGIWEIDLPNNQAFLSRSLAKLVGLPDKEQVLPLPQFLGLFYDGDREKLFSAVRRAHMTGPFEVDAQLAHIPIALACRGKPSVRGSDQAKVILGMALDVTETRGAQARLQAAEARLYDALSSMTDSFVIWDPMNRLVLWNERFESFFGFQPGTLQQGLEHATVAYHAEQAIHETYNSGDSFGEEIWLKDGRWVRYLESQTADGGRVSIGTDITEIRSREYDLRENEQALQKTVTVLKNSQMRIENWPKTTSRRKSAPKKPINPNLNFSPI